MASVYIAGMGMTVFGRHLERTLDDLAGEAGARQAAGARVAMQENGGGRDTYPDPVAESRPARYSGGHGPKHCAGHRPRGAGNG